MTLIIGLGNPGKKFDKTRHNLGFTIIDEFAKENDFLEFKFSKKFNAEISKKFWDSDEVILAKPQTYMNESGRTVKKIMSNVKCQMSNVWVVHDDLDLEIGKIKIVKNRGPAGHNGIKSIIENLGTKDFVRFRIGIRPIVSSYEHYKLIEKKFVLKKFTRDEKKILKQTLQKIVKAIETSLRQGIEKAMSEFN